MDVTVNLQRTGILIVKVEQEAISQSWCIFIILQTAISTTVCKVIAHAPNCCRQVFVLYDVVPALIIHSSV